MACGPDGLGVPSEHDVLVIWLFFTVRGGCAFGAVLAAGWVGRVTLSVDAQCGCGRVGMAFGREKILVPTRF